MEDAGNTDKNNDADEKLIPTHGGYRNLKSFQIAQIAQLAYDVTVRFCDRYINIRSRTHDQMVQAARSGVQNIAEGSAASGTSRKFELKLTSVARASLEELKLDYEDFLRHRSYAQWQRSNPLRAELISRRCNTAEEVATWIREVHARYRQGGQGGQPSDSSPQSSTEPIPATEFTSSEAQPSSQPPAYLPTHAEIAANAAHVLISVACSLLDRQIDTLADAFENEGGFTERLYRVRTAKRARQQRNPPPS